jgi:hypothetical protein
MTVLQFGPLVIIVSVCLCVCACVCVCTCMCVRMYVCIYRGSGGYWMPEVLYEPLVCLCVCL